MDSTPDRFARDGFVVLRELVGPPTLTRAGREVDRLHAFGYEPTCARPNNTIIPLRWNDFLVATILGNRDVVDGVAEITSGNDLRWISGYVSSEAPTSGPLPWHQDWWCWGHPISLAPDPAQVALLIYLTKTDGHRGALRLLPGSHRAGTPLHAALATADPSAGEPMPADHALMSDAPGQLTVNLSPGDAVLLDYRLLRGTHPNQAIARRDAVIVNFTPNWGSLPSEIRGHLISHSALPTADERPGVQHSHLLPDFAGTRADLPLCCVPPPSFAIADRSDPGTTDVPSWLPSDISSLIDIGEFAAVPHDLSKELDAEADALGVHLAAYRRAADMADRRPRPQLCRCLEVADLGIAEIHRLARLEARLDMVLVAYARPLSLRRDRPLTVRPMTP